MPHLILSQLRWLDHVVKGKVHHTTNHPLSAYERKCAKWEISSVHQSVHPLVYPANFEAAAS